MPEERGTTRVWVYARQFYIVDPDLGTDQAPDIADAGNGLIAVEEDGAADPDRTDRRTGRGHRHHASVRATAPRG